MIDPACGSGHFLLGSFRRILDRWQRNEPGANIRELVQRTLDSIHGVDINPYAVAIARFRLLLVAMKACGVTRLADAPAFHFNLVCGDSLLHGTGAQGSFGWHDFDHAYQTENPAELARILKPGHYHAVVANPPYITPKDKALNDAYRERYTACHRSYSLAVPFMQRLFQLAVSGYGGAQQAGFVGQITANSFMKREFGKKVIEEYFAGRNGTAGVDLTHVIDTAGAYIPGHGTPTVILFGRNRAPVAKTIRAVMGIRGEPSTPDDPARGLVWSAIVTQIDQPGSQSEFVSVADSSRELFHNHPWSIGGGGAAELKEVLEQQSEHQLSLFLEEVGASIVTREDEVYQVGQATARRQKIPSSQIRPLIDGEHVRDWIIADFESGVWPYDPRTFEALITESIERFLWPYRSGLAGRVAFGKTQLEHGKTWFEYSMFFRNRLRGTYRIAQAEVATHNHFALDRGGKVFGRTAPVVTLPSDATEGDYLSLLGLLNSSIAGFWLKAVCHNKGSTVDQHGARQRTDPFEDFYAFNATKLQQFPLPASRPTELARALDARAIIRSGFEGRELVERDLPLDREKLLARRALREGAIRQMIMLQEELDWWCYRAYGITDEDLCYRGDPFFVQLGQRAFEIVLARKVAAGEVQTTWFERHGSTPITELPADWPEDYKRLVERRIELIETDHNIGLIEQPEYKRRWNTESWESQLERALRSWLLDRLESYFDFDGRMKKDGAPRREGAKEEGKTQPIQNDLCALAPLREISLISISKVADAARQDPDFMQVGELYRDDPAFDVQRLVADLVEAESVPLLPVLRYKPTGLRKRTEWEQTWELQREEDRTGQRLDIPVPPKYTSADFLKSDCWRLRGKLDVPKERWVSFPYCEGPDGTPVIAWAGYDHLQLARAVSAYYVDIQERLGGRDDPRLVPLLACLLELLPWVKQWHNEPDAAFDGLRMGDYFEGFINEEARQHGKTVPEIKAWQPPQRASGRARRKTTT